MKEHLEVHHDLNEVSEEQMLRIYPTTIRRKVLRHLYLQPVKSCYLFKGCKQRFLDAILQAAKVELFLPGVQIMTEGDNIVDLMVVVAGEVSVAQGMHLLANSASTFSGSGALSGSEHMSFSGVSRTSMSFSSVAPEEMGDEPSTKAGEFRAGD